MIKFLKTTQKRIKIEIREDVYIYLCVYINDTRIKEKCVSEFNLSSFSAMDYL